MNKRFQILAIGLVLFAIAVIYLSYLPVNYHFDGTVFSLFLRNSILDNNLERLMAPHHFLYLPVNFLLYKSLNSIFGYHLLEYFHLQLFSLVFGLLSLAVILRILKKITHDLTLSLIGILFISFSYGFWIFSVEPEVHMPGFFFIISGVYLLFFKSGHKKWMIVSAFCFSMSSFFHLTNVLVCCAILVYFLYRKDKFRFITHFFLWYGVFFLAPYLVYHLISDFDLFDYFAHVFSRPDPFTGYYINYWSNLSLNSLKISFMSMHKAFIFPTSEILSVISIAFFWISIALTAIAFYLAKIKSFYYLLFFWTIPYIIFFSFWDYTNVEFKLNIFIPLQILLVIALAQIKHKNVSRAIMALLSIGIFFLNFYWKILPENEFSKNIPYQNAEIIKENTKDTDVIFISGCGTLSATMNKIYIPYFSHRKTHIVDWILGKGLGFNGITVLVQQELSAGKTVYFHSELFNENENRQCLLKNHAISANEYCNYLNTFKSIKKIPLIEKQYLIEVSPWLNPDLKPQQQINRNKKIL